MKKIEYQYCIPHFHGQDNWQDAAGVYNAALAAQVAAQIYGNNHNEIFKLEQYDCLVKIKEFVENKKDAIERIEVFLITVRPHIYYQVDKVPRVNCKECENDCLEILYKNPFLYSQGFCSEECCKRYDKH